MMKLGLALGVLLCASAAQAQESEWKQKLQEDMNVYVKDFASFCGATVKTDWVGGKLGHNPREPQKKGQNAVSVLCTCGLEAAFQACENSEVKKQLATLKEVQCTHGHGPLAYAHKGETLTITIDPAFVDKSPSAQRDDLKRHIIKDKDD